MYQNYQKTQCQCLICLKIIKNNSIKRIIKEFSICDDCLQQYKRIYYRGYLKGYPITILYDYDDFFKGLLYRYKGLYDYMLKDAFILNKEELKDTYKEYYVVVAPSDQVSNQKRQFAPNQAIAQTFSHKVFTGLYKKESFKQSDQRYEDRSHIKEIIQIRGGEFLRNQKVLILDDVITSSNTLKRCIELVEIFQPSCIEILVLSTKSYGRSGLY